ncbi:helix-turn-helix transcriptional regulator [Saccharibacillus brassicae]|nr:AraC family transcriptional regulator [Saccharibacillus brassicae]
MDHFSLMDHNIPTPLHIVNRHAHPSWSVPEGKRGFHNAMLVVSGRGTCYMNGEAQDMYTGQLFHHPMNHSFGYSSSADQPLHCLGGNFMVQTLIQDEQNGTLSTVERLPLNRCSYPGNFAILSRLFTDLAMVWSDPSSCRMIRCRSILLNIFSELLRDSGESYSARKGDEQIRKVAEYMKKHCASRHTLTELADLAELTPSYFGQRFKMLTGETPMEYLNSIRVVKALEYLALGYSISEASFRCGFNDPFYFTRVFKSKKGMSPSAYMNRGELML